MNEFERIHAFLKPLAARQPGALGLTDDAALLDPPPGRQLVVCADAMVEGVHFLPDTAPDRLARKLLRVNLSDLAAMGAEPHAYLTTLALPKGLGEGWLEGFARGLAEDQQRWPIDLIGGDCVSIEGPLSLSLTALGLVEPGKALRRAGARAGDRLFVTGTIGDGVLGLHALRGGLDGLPPGALQALAARYECPEPRLEAGRALAGLATAAIDVSDGLGADCGHIARESGLRAEIRAEAVPLSEEAWLAMERRPELTGTILAGGDDYELAFTAPAEAVEDIRAVAHATGIAITEIGAMVPDEPGRERVRYLDGQGEPVAVGQGWRHF